MAVVPGTMLSPWWSHLQNIASVRNVELGMSSDDKIGWIFCFLFSFHHQIERKLCCYVIWLKKNFQRKVNGSIAKWLFQIFHFRHNEGIKWKHFLRSRPFVRGIHWSPVNSLTKASDAELWCFLWPCAWTNGGANTRATSDLRCHLAHYDVNVMAEGNNCLQPVVWSD